MKLFRSIKLFKSYALMVVMASLLFSLVACGSVQKPDFSTEYQAIFTTTGHLMFGKIDKYTASYIVVKDVYLAQNTVDPNTKAVTNFVVSRSKQMHKPDMVYINQASVAMIEPVAPDSKLAAMIKEEKEKEKSQTAK